MNKLMKTAAAVVLSGLFFAMPAQAARQAKPAPVIDIKISISAQSMQVGVNGFSYANWDVSTARTGYYTPRGRYGVQRMARQYFSMKYDNAPMPYSVFFKGGYAIHATNYIRSLGTPASHGCVRLHPRNAALLYALVQKYGMNRTRITLVD